MLSRHGILNVAASGSSAIVGVVVIILGAVFNAKIGAAIKILSPRSLLVPGKMLLTVLVFRNLIGDDSHGVQHKCKVLLKMSTAQNLELKVRDLTILGELPQDVLGLNVVLSLKRLDDVSLLLLSLGVGDRLLVLVLNIALLHLAVGIATRTSGRLSELSAVVLVNRILLLVESLGLLLDK